MKFVKFVVMNIEEIRYHRCRVSFTMLSAVVVGKIAPKLTHLRIHWTINLSYQT